MSEIKLLPCPYRKTHKKLYEVWHAMKQRCNNKNNSRYKLYGGRGITYCTEWEKAENFCEWALHNGYEEGLEIDRIDVNGNYEPSNCRWVDRKTNAQNQRRALLITVDNETKCVSEWERELHLGKSIIVSWVKRWGVDFAIERIKEVKATGTYTKYKKNGVKNKICKEEGGIE